MAKSFKGKPFRSPVASVCVYVRTCAYARAYARARVGGISLPLDGITKLIIKSLKLVLSLSNWLREK